MALWAKRAAEPVRVLKTSQELGEATEALHGAAVWSTSSMAARRMRSPAAGDIRLLQVLAINGDMGEVAIAGHWARVRTVRQSR